MMMMMMMTLNKRGCLFILPIFLLLANFWCCDATVQMSKRRVTNSTVTGISSTDNLPFATAVDDNTDWWDSTNNRWVVGRSGLFLLEAIVTFDQANIEGFPPSVRYDHQVHAWINGALNTDLFLAIYANKGDNSTVLQQRLEGENTYRLNTNDTVAVRIQTRIYPYNVVDSAITAGTYALTEGSLRFIGV